MKRALFAALSILILFSGISYGADARFVRWENRLENLKGLKSSVEKSKYKDKQLLSLIDNEIKESDKFLDILIRVKAGDGSLQAAEREYSIPEIEKRVNELAGPVISLYYLSALLNRPLNTPLKDQIRGEILKYITEKNRGLSFRPGNDELETLTLQYINEEGMGEFDKTGKKLIRDILSKTEYDLSRSDYVSNDINFEHMIFKNALIIAEAYDFNSQVKFLENYLISAPDWNFTAKKILTKDKMYKAMRDFAGERDVVLPADFTGTDIGSFEKLIFDSNREILTSSLGHGAPSGAKSYNTPLYEIPDFSRFNEAVNEIDKYRGSVIRVLSGTEGEVYVKRVRNNNSGIAARYIRHYENVIKREEARIGRLKSGNSALIIYNEEIFFTAKKHFGEIKELLNSYSELSSDFIERICLAGVMTPAEYTAFHRYRNHRSLEQGLFFQSLTESSVPLSQSGIERINGIYRSAYLRGVNFIRGLFKIEAIPAHIRGGMTSEILKEYSTINRDLRTRGSLIAESIRGDYSKYDAARAEHERIRSERAGKLEGQIAQEEINVLLDYAAACAELLLQMNYTERALLNYREKYSLIESELKNNNLKGYEKIITGGSLIPAVEDFNPELIDREMYIRSVLAKEGEDALVTAVSLNTFHRRHGVEMKFFPPAGDIAELRRNLKSAYNVKIAAWIMDGSNFRDIDLNASEALKKMLSRKAWLPGSMESSGAGVTFSTGRGSGFSAVIPAGWREGVPGEKREGNFLLYKVYVSPDGSGRIEVSAVKKGEDRLNDLSREWLRRGRFSMVQQRWGKKEGNDYYRAVSKNRHDHVMELFIIERDDYIIILSGRTSGDRYNNLSRHLDEIFASVKSEDKFTTASAVKAN